MACIMNLPLWTLSMFSMWLSHSQRAAGQGQQETNSCQANFPLMHGWFSRRSSAVGLWVEMGHEVAVICTIKSSCFTSKLRLEMFLADIQSQSWGFMIGSSHRKIHCWTHRKELWSSCLGQRAVLHRAYEVTELRIALNCSIQLNYIQYVRLPRHIKKSLNMLSKMNTTHFYWWAVYNGIHIDDGWVNTLEKGPGRKPGGCIQLFHRGNTCERSCRSQHPPLDCSWHKWQIQAGRKEES